jgi:hypothetical protein
MAHHEQGPSHPADDLVSLPSTLEGPPDTGSDFVSAETLTGGPSDAELESDNTGTPYEKHGDLDLDLDHHCDFDNLLREYVAPSGPEVSLEDPVDPVAPNAFDWVS